MWIATLPKAQQERYFAARPSIKEYWHNQWGDRWTELFPAERIRDAVMAGDVTQLHRGDKHASEGDRFAIFGKGDSALLFREPRWR
nr:hypothetical protein [Halovenus salina]